MNLKNTLRTLTLASAFVSATAMADNARAVFDQIEKIQSATPLKVQTLNAVELEDGQILFISQNGRFVVQGRLTDVWTKQALDTMDEIKHASTHVDLDSLNMDLSQMNTFTFGSGPQRVVLFADPNCSFCKKYIEDARAKADARYHYTVVVVPALGDDSNRLSRNLFCAADKSNAVDLFLNGGLDTLIQRPNCDIKQYDLTLTLAQMLEITAVPYFIAPDGRYRTGGNPADVNNWLMTPQG